MTPPGEKVRFCLAFGQTGLHFLLRNVLVVVSRNVARGLRSVEKILGEFRKAMARGFAPGVPVCDKLTEECSIVGELIGLVNDCFRWQWHYLGTLQ